MRFWPLPSTAFYLAAAVACLGWPTAAASQEPGSTSGATGAVQEGRALSYSLDILPILSKQGCNNGNCHGKAIGQNGFRLSLFGFDPAFDYAALAHEGRGRRVSPASPDDSLILLKAAGGMPHGGGVRFSQDSQAYALLRRWVAEGLPFAGENDPREVRLEVSPNDVKETEAREVSLSVYVHYSDGTNRDVTLLARYDSQHPELAAVSEGGQLRLAGMPGETHIMVRYNDLVSAVRVLTPYSPAPAAEKYAHFVPRNFIDELALAKWRELQITPSPAASDEEFLRRAFLDTLGTLPTPEEVRQLLADAAPNKRDALIEKLLSREEFLDYWAHRLGDLLRNRLGDSNAKENTIAFAKWIRQSLAENKPYDRFVREIVTVSGKRSDHPQMDWYRWAINSENRVEDTAQAFLGLRVSCANCHNHPFENISQTDYWRFAAFFARVGSVTYGSVDEIKLNEKGEIKHPRTDRKLTPKAFSGPEFDYKSGEDPRLYLADWMTAPDNPYFARAIVNRVWGHYLGVGLVHPVDDMRATNPPSNPQLLDALARDFVEHQFDLKHLMKVILTSGVYALSALSTEDNQADTRNYARYYARRMAPHVLLDAISDATGVPTKFEDYPEVKRAILLPNERGRSDFLEIFGRSERVTPCECETSLAPNLSQALYLLHSDELERKISHKSGFVAALAGAEKPADESITELFLRTFSRPPRTEELEAAKARFEQAASRRVALEDLLWALLNSKEFLFNH